MHVIFIYCMGAYIISMYYLTFYIHLYTYTNKHYKYKYLSKNTEPVPHQVYQSLDRELQKHVSHQDTLQQCETWLSTVQEEIQLHSQTPFGLQEALKQVSERPNRLLFS